MATGKETWLLPIDVAFTPAISPDGAIAYVVSTKDKALRAVRADDGKVSRLLVIECWLFWGEDWRGEDGKVGGSNHPQTQTTTTPSTHQQTTTNHL